MFKPMIRVTAFVPHRGHHRRDVHGLDHANRPAYRVVVGALQHLGPTEDAVMEAVAVEHVVDAVDAGLEVHAELLEAADSG
jgi:hypothetical protein